MPTCRQLCAVATLISCACALGAADSVTSEYSFEELSNGRDIHEGIYGSNGDGEFDEWRLHLGYAPALDRIQLKGKVNGDPYPGPPAVETDKVISDPAVSPQIGLVWVLGDYARGDQGWFYTLGLEYTHREYQILYGLGTLSNELKLNAVSARMGMGYAWYLNPHLRYEIEPFLAVGVMWNELDLLDLSAKSPTIRSSSGPLIEGGLRNALIWHPASTQAWHLGVALDYRSGYAQATFHDKQTSTSNGATDDTLDSEVRMWWYGFGASLFYGRKF